MNASNNNLKCYIFTIPFSVNKLKKILIVSSQQDDYKDPTYSFWETQAISFTILCL